MQNRDNSINLYETQSDVNLPSDLDKTFWIKTIILFTSICSGVGEIKDA